MKGREAMVIVGLRKSSSAMILNELLNVFGSDIGIGTKPEEGQMVVSVLEPSIDSEI